MAAAPASGLSRVGARDCLGAIGMQTSINSRVPPGADGEMMRSDGAAPIAGDGNHRRTAMIAITVSTNYHDILKLVLAADLQFFDRWIFVTDVNDIQTIDVLTRHDVIVLYHDFKNGGRVFDKGGAVAMAQQFAYRHYPDQWYLLMDSDICLSPEFAALPPAVQGFDADAVYGAKRRHDFGKLSDYRAGINYFEYPWGDQLQGYFQLYKKKVLYQSSRDASACDLDFLAHFDKKVTIDGFVCNHLGRKGNWQGRKVGEDFDFDVA